MSMTPADMAITILVVTAGTVFTRFLPYIAFPEGRKIPKYVTYLGKVLGPAVFGLLCVYCFRNTDFITSFAAGGNHGIPAIIGLVVTVAVFAARRQMFLSMAAGTAAYMIVLNLL